MAGRKRSAKNDGLPPSRQMLYYAANRAKVLAKKAAARAADPEGARARDRRRNAANPGPRRAQAKSYAPVSPRTADRAVNLIVRLCFTAQVER